MSMPMSEAERLALEEGARRKAQESSSGIDASGLADVADAVLQVTPEVGRLAAAGATRVYERVAYPTGYRTGADDVLGGSGGAMRTTPMESLPAADLASGAEAAAGLGEAAESVVGLADAVEVGSALGDVAEGAGGLVEGIGDILSGLG
jgi:hypothetical protein